LHIRLPRHPWFDRGGLRCWGHTLFDRKKLLKGLDGAVLSRLPHRNLRTSLRLCQRILKTSCHRMVEAAGLLIQRSLFQDHGQLRIRSSIRRKSLSRLRRRSSITAIVRYVMGMDRTYAVSRRGAAFVIMQLRRKNAWKLNPNGQHEGANEPQNGWIEELSVRPDPIELRCR
jgi:hypothetical protein